MRSRTQIILLSSLTLVLASAAIGLGIYTFKGPKNSSIDYLVKDSDNRKDNSQVSKEKTAMELNKDKKSDNLTQQTIASLVDIVKSKNQNPELSDEELKKYLRDKMSQVDTFSYSFTKGDIKTVKDKNTKQDTEDYLNKIYNIIPRQTIFAGTLNINDWDNLEQSDLNKELENLIKVDKQAFDDLSQVTAPSDAANIHETYLKLINLEIIFFQANQQMETDPLKSKSIFSNIKTELPELKQILDQELSRISKKYGIELQITN